MIYQYALDGRFLRGWSSTDAIVEKYSPCKRANNLHSCLRGEADTFAEFRWSREKLDQLPYPTHPNTLMLLRLSQTPILQVHKVTGKITEWPSIRKAADWVASQKTGDYAAARTNIVTCLKNGKTYFESYWRWQDPERVPGQSVHRPRQADSALA